ncbi:MAG: cation:proton antiporter [Candidatus Contendobacter sp.]|nr:cation:proton antiporter [Candidatus Contendobacter sp.]
MPEVSNPLIFSLFLIFTGAALFATLALFARQALPIAYIVLGILIGPYGFKLINNVSVIDEMAQIGIMFLLFLLGLDLSPQRLLQMLRKATLITLGTSLTFAAIGGWIAWRFGYTLSESLLVGVAMTFSSTIIGLKLLPTRTLHHQHTGEIIISILLLQDLLAIAVLLLVEGLGGRGSSLQGLGLLIITLPSLLSFAYLVSRYVLVPLIRRFDKIREYIFLIAIGWCLCLSQIAALLGLSYAIGAFIGGVALATSPIALYIADSLRPLRDFFLVLFFFSLGAGFDTGMLGAVFAPTLVLGGLLIIVKPWVFRGFLQWAGERPRIAMEVGVRLGQVSEFALLIAVLAQQNNLISREASYLVQATTLFTFIASTYYLVLKYPTPVAISDSLRRD